MVVVVVNSIVNSVAVVVVFDYQIQVFRDIVQRRP